jgi:hypothetical protein
MRDRPVAGVVGKTAAWRANILINIGVSMGGVVGCVPRVLLVFVFVGVDV